MSKHREILFAKYATSRIMVDAHMASKNYKDFVEANETFKEGFNEGGKELPPARKATILTCMDARVPVDKFLGLKNGDCNIIRNAGGRVTPGVLRDLAISKLFLRTEEIYVIHHVDCGLLKANDAQAQGAVKEHLGEAADKESKRLKIEWLTFTDLAKSVQEDIKLLRESSLVHDSFKIHGFVYDINKGGLIPVEEA